MVCLGADMVPAPGSSMRANAIKLTLTLAFGIGQTTSTTTTSTSTTAAWLQRSAEMRSFETLWMLVSLMLFLSLYPSPPLPSLPSLPHCETQTLLESTTQQNKCPSFSKAIESLRLVKYPSEEDCVTDLKRTRASLPNALVMNGVTEL